MKIRLELIINSDGSQYLNYWDYLHGDDVCCDVIDGKLYKSSYGEDGKELPKVELTLPEFIKAVEERQED